MEELITSMLSVVLAGAVISVIIVFIIFILFIGINIAEKLSGIVVNKIERYFERKALTDNWKRPWF